MNHKLPIKLELPPNFLEEEIRDEYLVTEKAKKIWAVELDLANELLRVCKKHNIEIYAFAGTLLGAVRHGGFIPWDDDMDFCMTRENFEKLIHVAETEFQEPYFLQTGYNDQKFFLGYARLRNSQTTGIIKGNMSAEYNNGIHIDVFVMDGLCENLRKRKIQLAVRHYLTRFAVAYNTPSTKIHVLVAKYTLCKMIPYTCIMDIYHKVLMVFNKSAKRVSFLATPNPVEIENYSIEAENLSGDQFLAYECLPIPVPQNYPAILESTYGDYMKFPPVEQRGKWHEDVITFDPDISYKEYISEYVSEGRHSS